jgi:hypothetical protein
MHWIASAVVAAGLLTSVPGSAAEKARAADRFDVGLILGRDGSMMVTETIVVRFEGGPFSSVTRTLPKRTYDGIVDIAAAMDGTPLPPGRGPGQVLVKRGEDGRTITWYCSPVTDSTRTFTLSYRVLGVIERLADQDRLRWVPVPARRDYPIRSGAVRLEWPAGASLIGPPAISSGTVRVSDDGRHATFEIPGLDRRQTVELSAGFSPGSTTAVAPGWQLRRDRGRAMAPAFAIGAGTVLLAGIAWIVVFWNSHRRDPMAGPSPAREMAPPETLPVALAGAILSPGAGGTWSHALASLLDLARRGVVRIEEMPGRTWHGSRDYVIHLVSQTTDLRPHERGLLDLLFTTKAGPITNVKLSAAGRAAQSRLKLFQHPLGEELLSASLVSPEHVRTRGVLVRAGLLLVAVAAAGFVGAAIATSQYGGWPLLVPASLALVAVSVLIMASCYSVLTNSGRYRAARWASFFKFVRDVAKGRRPITDAAWFEQYLPYAAVRGQAPQWVKVFDRSGKVASPPAWFAAAAASDRSVFGRLAEMLSSAQAAGVQRKHAAV